MSRWLANLVLLLVAVIWGSAFVAQQWGMDHVGPWTFTGVRFLLGAAFVAPWAWREWRRAQAQGQQAWRDFPSWLLLGVVLTLGAVLQQIGLQDTSVSNAGFLTALYVPLVPILARVFLREPISLSIVPAAAGSLLGTYWLSGGNLAALTWGDAWVLASTLFWAIHVVWVGVLVVRARTPVMIAMTQFAVCGLVSMVMAVLLEPLDFASVVKAMPTIAYGGILSVGVAYTLQVVAQAYTRAADAAILLSSEILFAAVAGAWFMHERLTGLQWAGGLLIFASIMVVQLVPLWLQSGRRSE